MIARRSARRIASLVLVALLLSEALPVEVVPAPVARAAVVNPFASMPEESGAIEQSPAVVTAPNSAVAPSFTPEKFGAIEQSRAVAFGDLNGDGALDMIIGNGSTGLTYADGLPNELPTAPSKIYLNKNDGTGQFLAPVSLPLNAGELNYTTSVAVGDLDNNGTLDIVLGAALYWGYPNNCYVGSRSTPQAVSVQNLIYFNNGSGTFAPPVVLSNADATTSVALGDVDGKNGLDIVVGNDWSCDSTPSRVYLNDGTGAFAASTLGYSAAESVALGDVNSDKALDIVIGNGKWGYGQASQIYINQLNAQGQPTGTFGQPTSLNNTDNTSSVALGDLDGDGHLDLVLGNYGGFGAEGCSNCYPGAESIIYENDGVGTFSRKGPIGSGVKGTVRGVTLGDVNGDGALDIVTADGFSPAGGVESYTPRPNLVYLNTLVNGKPAGTFSAPLELGKDLSAGIALADLEGDGRLDLVALSINRQNTIYHNSKGAGVSASTVLTGQSNSHDLQAGDLDGDGALDIVSALANGVEIAFGNNNGGFQAARYVVSTTAAEQIALGDLNNDGHLDLVATRGRSTALVGTNDIYLNTDGAGTGHNFVNHAFGSATDNDTSVALGDFNGDGWLDIVVAGNPMAVYVNDGAGGFPEDRKRLLSGTITNATQIAVGDFDGDGSLDIAIAALTSLIYLNDGLGSFTLAQSIDTNGGSSVATGDLDGDTALDLVIGRAGTQSAYYLNNGAGRFAAGKFFSNEDFTQAVALNDVNGDDTLDIISGNRSGTSYVHLNNGVGKFSALPFDNNALIMAIAIGDFNADGAQDIVLGGDEAAATTTIYRNTTRSAVGLPNNPPQVVVARPGPNAGFYSTPQILTDQVIPISYRVSDAEYDQVNVQAQYSPDGGGSWQNAVVAVGTPTRDLATNCGSAGCTYTYGWDTFASGFRGESDNLVFRIKAWPSSRSSANSVPDSYQRPYAAATTFPFRVGGTRIQVLNQDGTPATGAVVYPLSADPENPAAPFINDLTKQPFQVNGRGILAGHSQFNTGERLVALLKVQDSEKYTLYHTSAKPNSTDLDAFPVTTLGVQTLTVSSATPLMLLNLSVSLEWDARSDTGFVKRLNDNMQQVSAALYDWTDGQVTLGEITIYQNKERWYDTFDTGGKLTKGADIRIYATNSLRPNASQGGIVAAAEPDPSVPATVYDPGHVRIGSVWNKDGSVAQIEGSTDWPRTLAHELGHYALYLDDNYIGLNDAHQLINVDACPGAMSDPYRDDYSEFHPDAGWLPACKDTLSNRSTSRSDWATIQTFYNNAKIPGLTFTPPATFNANAGPSNLVLDVTHTTFRDTGLPAAAPALWDVTLVNVNNTPYKPTESARAFLFTGDRIRDLGQPPTGIALRARGAAAGDTLCVYDLPVAYRGCAVNGAGNSLTLRALPTWKPDVVIAPSTARQFTISVAADGVGTPAPQQLKARLFAVDSDQTSPPVDLTLANGQYSGAITMSDPVFEGYVQVWVDENKPKREVVTDYALGGNPAPPRRPARRSRRKAPAVSNDGQVILFGDDLDFKDGEFFSLQTATRLPTDPSIAVPIGPGYRLIASTPAPPLAGVGISMSYADADYPRGTEGGIAIYYYPPDNSGWQRLPSVVDADDNTVSAQVAQPGLYVLMASLPFTLGERGWQPFDYPGATAPLPDALKPIAGSYRMVYGYDTEIAATDPLQAWQVYAPAVPPWVNDLRQLEQNEPYRIYVQDPLTTLVKPPVAGLAALPQSGSPLPSAPALFYAALTSAAGFSPQAGVAVEARVNGVLCGEATTKLVDGKVVVAIDVLAAGAGELSQCGSDGLPIRFTIGDYAWPVKPVWDNTRLNELRIYTVLLPVVRDGRAVAPVTTPTPTPDPGEPEE